MFTGRLRSFKHAFTGIFTLLRSQRNAWVHTVATLAVCAAGFYFNLQRGEWCWIVLAIMAVWVAEALNTAMEFLADAVVPMLHPLIGKAKDVAAGSVLIAAMGSAVIGAVIFWPHVLP